ncbi:H-NS family nucleoid-associated regulatory protein [Burkholderia pseudomallei]|uniref:H-NS family nucleoid-associated regulatory protein n=1 Tax=Burkholderia pseudomallei TaxID=28450 RepID=UPI001AD73295|nr:H-NS family nucleoid-associated regulatory protein [Burkholderia pseudomallei]MBO7803472.1 H-NS histone family protein [Burkholderia pseudomallei]
MAEAKKLTLAEILAKREEFEKMVAAQMEAERPAALQGVREQIKMFNFTAEELGFKATAAAKASTGTKGGSGATRNISKPLKSTKSDETGVWLAHPPKFLEAEGAFATYKSGKSIDAWLVDAKDKKAKINFLKKLASREGKVPSKEQLHDITEADFNAA